MSRLDKIRKNTAWQIISVSITVIVSFISRIIFMRVLGEEYLGLNSLFSSMVSFVSFADLGVIGAFSFCFYRPIAEKNTASIQSLLYFFKKSLNYVIVLMLVIGIIGVFFLDILTKSVKDIKFINIIVYYLISLFNMVSGYFFMHKISYITANQESYKLVIFNIMCNLFTAILQIIALIYTRKYFYWALSSLIVLIIFKVIINNYINKNYPYVKIKTKVKLKQNDKTDILQNAKAVIIHKIGNLSIYQAESIIVSTFIGIATNGLLFNYEMIKTTIFNIVRIPIDALSASLGDILASENKNVQLDVFYTVNFVSHILFGIAFCVFSVLATPFITIIFGANKSIGGLSVFFIGISFYTHSMINCLDILPTLSGNLKLLSKISAIIGAFNIVLSIISINVLGLWGMFLTTSLIQIFNLILRANVIFKNMYKISANQYYKNIILYFTVNILTFSINMYIINHLNNISIFTLIIMGFSIIVTFIIINFIFFFNNKYSKIAINTILVELKSYIKK